jgi:ribonucleoside-diphosphate reductase alpha chain
MIDALEQNPPSPRPAKRRRPAPKANRRPNPAATVPRKKSLPLERIFSDAKVKPFDQIEWDRRTAEITDDAGKVIFKQENVEVPKSWSPLAT